MVAVRFAEQRLFPSPLVDVPDEAWDVFLRASSTRKISEVSRSGAIGSFELRPRRLGELGVMVNLRRGPGGIWVGDLAPKYANLKVSGGKQREVFEISTKAYDDELSAGTFAKPDGVTRSGAHAILHFGGRGAIESWPERAFLGTRAAFERTNGLF